MNDAVVSKLDNFFSSYPTIHFAKSAMLLEAYKKPSGIFYVQSGIVRRYYLSAEGSEVTLNLYKPHTFLPMSWAIADVPNTHFYEAASDVITHKASKEDVLAFLQREPDVVYDLLKRVYIGMEGLWMHMESLTAGNSLTKLAASLVILTKRFGKKENDGIRIDLQLSEQDLANYAGMTRETASRELQKMKKENLVSFSKGKLFVHDLSRLEALLVE